VKFVNGWPVLGRIRFCFAQLPYVQMAARPLYKGGIDVTYFPGAASWLVNYTHSPFFRKLVHMYKLIHNSSDFCIYIYIYDPFFKNEF
jgi:hypothetical protein